MIKKYQLDAKDTYYFEILLIKSQTIWAVFTSVGLSMKIKGVQLAVLVTTLMFIINTRGTPLNWNTGVLSYTIPVQDNHVKERMYARLP